MQAGRMHPDTVSPTAGRIYAEICTRRKAYETRGISCCAPFVYAGNGFLASRPSPPCAPRPGYRALFIRYERCLHGIFKTWRCSKIRAITDNFFSFIYTYICMYERCTKYICIYVCTKRNVLRWIIGLSRSGTRMENFTAADQKKEGTSVGKDGSRTEPDGAGYRAIHLVQTTTS